MRSNGGDELMSAGKWWRRPVRMMRVDHAPDFSAVKRLDLEEMARSRKEDWQVNCEWIVGVPGFVGGGTVTTFHAEGYERYPGFEDFDYLREYTPIAHKHGIRVVTYLNGHFYPSEFGEMHPDWEQITCRGLSYGKEHPLYGSGTTMCVNSPWRDWMFGIIREAAKTGVDGVFLDGPVVFPDSCYCPHCRSLFRERFGAEIPQEDWTNPLWRKFVGFREDSLAAFLKDARQVVKEVNPDAVIFLNGGNWYPGGWRVARDIQKVAPYEDFNGAEAFFHYGEDSGLYSALMAGKYLRAGSKPPIVFIHYMDGVWHYLLLASEQLKLHLVQAASAGANPWIACFDNGIQSKENGHEPANDVFGFMARNEEYYTDAESIADVAILFSACTSQFYLSRFDDFYSGGGKKKEENLVLSVEEMVAEDSAARKRACEKLLTSSYKGYFEALTRGHVPFDVVLDESLTPEKLSKYKILILPDAACLSAESAEAVRNFVANGGNLFSSFEAGFYDQNGDWSDALLDVLGIEDVEGIFPVTMGENYLQATEDHLGFSNGVLIERAPYAIKVKAKPDSKVSELFLEPIEGAYLPLKGVTSYPGLVTSAFGKGKTVYFAEAIGNFFDSWLPSAEDRICRTLSELSGGFSVEFDGPRTVSVEAYRQNGGNRIVIHLVNNTVDGRAVREFLPVGDLQLRLHVDRKPSRVFGLRENLSVESNYSDATLSISIPKLMLYDVVVVEY